MLVLPVTVRLAVSAHLNTGQLVVCMKKPGFARVFFGMAASPFQLPTRVGEAQRQNYKRGNKGRL